MDSAAGESRKGLNGDGERWPGKVAGPGGIRRASLSDGYRVLAVPAGIIFPRTVRQQECRGGKSTESGSSRIEKTACGC